MNNLNTTISCQLWSGFEELTSRGKAFGEVALWKCNFPNDVVIRRDSNWSAPFLDRGSRPSRLSEKPPPAHKTITNIPLHNQDINLLLLASVQLTEICFARERVYNSLSTDPRQTYFLGSQKRFVWLVSSLLSTVVSATTSIEMLFENYLFNGLWEASTGNGKLLGALRGSGTNSTTRLLRLAERLGKCHNFLHLAQTRLNCQYLTQLAQYDLTSLSLALSAEITDFDVSELVHELIVVRSGRGDKTRAPILVPRAHSSGFQNVTYRSPEVILFYIYKLCMLPYRDFTCA